VWSIFSNNCWGSGLYQETNISYNTPTVGLWFHPDDYIRLLEDFRKNMSKPLNFIPKSRLGPDTYPIGLIGDDIEIHFLHYHDAEEAKDKWTRRTVRMPSNDDDIYFKICDRDGFSDRHLTAFDKLPFKNKIGFIKQGRFDLTRNPWAIGIDTDLESAPDGVTLWELTKQMPNFDPYRWVKQDLHENVAAPPSPSAIPSI
jgi:uncharacterized protein (DUF1919 family)